MFFSSRCVFKVMCFSCIRHFSQSSKFKGKVALITGSTLGIGLATARRFAQEGAKVIISSRKQKNVDGALKMLHAEGLASHVAKKEDRNLLLYEAEKLGGIDILLQNAGANPNPGKIINCTESMWDKVMETNLKATFFLAKEALPLMKQRGGGSIILMSSITGYLGHPLVGAAYSVSKSGLLVLTKAMAQEFAEYNIRVNCVTPGAIETNFAQILHKDLKDILRNVPLNRCGKPEEISGVISFLASQDASYITGESIVISGGWHARL